VAWSRRRRRASWTPCWSTSATTCGISTRSRCCWRAPCRRRSSTSLRCASCGLATSPAASLPPTAAPSKAAAARRWLGRCSRSCAVRARPSSAPRRRSAGRPARRPRRAAREWLRAPPGGGLHRGAAALAGRHRRAHGGVRGDGCRRRRSGRGGPRDRSKPAADRRRARAPLCGSLGDRRVRALPLARSQGQAAFDTTIA
jgi:hypothetical protein